MPKHQPYKMTIDLNVLEHLGIGLYSNIPAVIAEAVANAWDADAEHVHIIVDTPGKTISISDDGCGMGLQDINNKYLRVGYEKRKYEECFTPKFKRPVMGRKGIGKLSLFSVANKIEILTIKDGEKNGFLMDVEDIKATALTDEAYFPAPINKSDIEIDRGTRLTIRDLKIKRLGKTSESLKKRLARRFSIIGSAYNFNIEVDGKEISVEDRGYFNKLQYIWIYGHIPASYLPAIAAIENPEHRVNLVEIDEDEATPIQYKINGWIGSVKRVGTLKDGDDNLNKIALMSRGKLAQEDILEDFGEGGVFSKYLVGEIDADFLDLDDQEDIATSSRQDIKRDNPRYVALSKFIGQELKHIQNVWTDLRNKGGAEEAFKYEVIKEWFDSLSSDNKRHAEKLFGKINQLSLEEEEKKHLYKLSIVAFESFRYKENLEALDKITPQNVQAFAEVFGELDDIEAILYHQIVEERLRVIEVLIEKVEENALEKVIQKYLYDHLWLLDPSWERATQTPMMEKSVAAEFKKIDAKLTPEEKSGRLDIKYKAPSGKHVVIELKRADRTVSATELLEQTGKYRDAIIKLLASMGKSNQVVEVICVVGKELKGWDDSRVRDEETEMLSARHTSRIQYNELIQHAQNSYKEFLDKKKEAGRLYDIIMKLDKSDIVIEP